MEPDGTQKQLYTLNNDRKETKNLVNGEKKIAEELSQMLKSWYANVVQKNKTVI